MEAGRLFFDPTSGCHAGNMLFLGNGDPVFRGPTRSSMMSMDINESSKKRPFFSSPEDLYDDDYYDDQLPEKKRRLTPEQVHLLEKSFESENKLEPDRKSQLAKKLGLQPRQVAVWFQNRRARWKTKQLERDYDLLKSSYDSLSANYDSILKHNDNLKSQVASLMEKLKGKEGAEIAGGGVGVENNKLGDEEEIMMGVMKVEDRVSTGSGGGGGGGGSGSGSGVVDDHDQSPHLLDSGDSCYFHHTTTTTTTTTTPNSDLQYSTPPCNNTMSMSLATDEEDEATHYDHNHDHDQHGGPTYFSDDVFPDHQHNNQVDDGDQPLLGWWVWS
ncbi:hypothetical protein CsatB_021542 [Cannabis sativa]